MKLVRSLLTASMGLTLAGTQVSAADFFVQPLRPGPVTGAALNAISLQGYIDADAEESVPDASLFEDEPPAADAGEESARTETDTEAGAKTTAGAKGAGFVTAGTAKAKWVKARSTTKVAEAATGPATEANVAKKTKPGKKSAAGSESATPVASAGEGTASGSGGETTSPVVQPAPQPAPTTPQPQPTTPMPSTPTTVTGPAPVQTAGQTYPSFGALMKSGKVQGGDRVFLLAGYHGPMIVDGQYYASPVLITEMPGQVAQVDNITVRRSKNIVFQGFKVWTSPNANGLVAQVRSYGDSSDLTFTGLDVRAVAGATGYNTWTATDWTNNQRGGFLIDGPRQTVARNRVTGVFNGIIMQGQDALMEENIVDGFSGDGMRALGDNSVVRRNKVQNCHQIGANHTDGFQSFSRGANGKVGTGVVRNVLIEDNKIFEFVGTRSALNCKLQGISLFDGMYDGWVIRNNVISSTAYHGITIGGGLNSQITNNTVIHAQGLAGKFPWIRVASHKNGTGSRNVTVANNLVTSLKVWNNASAGIVETNNVTVTNASGEFTGLNAQDFTLRSTAKAIDAGKVTLAPTLDIIGNARPKGKAPDAGAYESF